MPPSSIRRAHCNLEGMTSKPIKKSTLKRKAESGKKVRGWPKDVVIKVHKVPESAKYFQADRSLKPSSESESTEPAPPLTSTTSSTSDTSSNSLKRKSAPTDTEDDSALPATSSTLSTADPPSNPRKRKSAPESATTNDTPVHKKAKTNKTKKKRSKKTETTETTAHSSEGSSNPRKRKATCEPETVEEASADKKRKTETGEAKVTTPPSPTSNAFQLKDDGTHRTCFLDLPAEIRNDIYNDAMDERLNINPGQAWGNEHPLLRTCKQIRADSGLVFHQKTKFQTNKTKHAWMFLNSRTREQKASLSSIRISVPSKLRAAEHTFHYVRRTLNGFRRIFHRKGLDDSVVKIELPVYDPDNDKVETHWPSLNEIGLYETMAGRRRNSRGNWENISFTVLKTDAD